MMKEKNFFQRFNDKDNALNRKEFVIWYFGYWLICIFLISLIEIIFEPRSLKGLGIGLSFGFFTIFVQRLRYLGLSKWWALLALPLITNPLLFLFLVVKNKKADF